MNDRPRPGSRTASRFHDERSVPPAMIAGRMSPQAPTRRTTLRVLPLALGVAAGIALVSVGVSLFSHHPETSAAVQSPAVAPIARRVCADLTTQQYDDLYRLLATAEKALGTSNQFVASQRQLDAQRGTASTCAYAIGGQDATSATLTLTLTRGVSPTTPAQVRLTLEHGAWRIADYDTSLVAAPGGQFHRERSPSSGG